MPAFFSPSGKIIFDMDAEAVFTIALIAAGFFLLLLIYNLFRLLRSRQTGTPGAVTGENVS